MRWQKTSRDWGVCFFVTSKLPEGDVPEWGSGSRGKGGGGSGEVGWGEARFGKGGGGSQGRWEVLFRGSLKNCPVLNRQQVRKSVLSRCWDGRCESVYHSSPSWGARFRSV